MSIELIFEHGDDTDEQPAEPVRTEPHADGIYLNLPAEAYHNDTALGSTDMKDLASEPCDYWHTSALNEAPEVDTKESAALIFGSAVHTCLIEGRQAFDGRYAPTFHRGNLKAGKEEVAVIRGLGKTPIKKVDFDRILVAADAIKANTHLAEAFSGGISEVSIFWTRNGIRRKARIDHLKRRASTDLKSLRNWRSGRSFIEACHASIANFRYDVQAEHYIEARGAMLQLIRDGAVFGDHDKEWLTSAASWKKPAFVFIFYQAEGAPLTWGRTLSPGNPILAVGRKTIMKAEANYKSYVERFGLDMPWRIEEPLGEMQLSDLPGWFGRDR